MGSRASHPPRNLYASWSVRPTSTEEAEMISAVLERQREPPRSLRGWGAARSGLRGRGLGGRHRPPPPTPLASHLRHFPRAPGRGHRRCSATDGSLERRHDHEVPAPVRRGPTCRHRPGVPGKLRPPRSPSTRCWPMPWTQPAKHSERQFCVSVSPANPAFSSARRSPRPCYRTRRPRTVPSR